MPNLDALLALAKQAKKIIAPIKPAEINIVPRSVQQAALLGRGTQDPERWLAQLRNRPGVSPAELDRIFSSVKGQGPLTAVQLANAATPAKRYMQRAGQRSRDYSDDAMDETIFEMAHDLMWNRDHPRFRGLYDEALADYLGSLSEPNLEAENIARNFDRVQRRPIDHPERIQWRNAAEAMQHELDRNSAYGFADFVDESDIGEQIRDLATDLAHARVERTPGLYMEGIPANRIDRDVFQDFQRQIQGVEPEPPYFESVLRVSPQRAKETGLPQRLRPGSELRYTGGGPYHFDNEGQLGHIRGSIVRGGDFASDVIPGAEDRNHMLVEEIQADPMERPGKASPDLRNIYGQLGNAAIERAAAADLGGVIFPTGRSITNVRQRDLQDFYERVYDRDLTKNVFDPLHRAGFTITDTPGFRAVDLPEGAKEAILDPKQRILGYADGGSVQPSLAERIALLERRAGMEHTPGPPGTEAKTIERGGISPEELKAQSIEDMKAGVKGWPADAAAWFTGATPLDLATMVGQGVTGRPIEGAGAGRAVTNAVRSVQGLPPANEDPRFPEIFTSMLNPAFLVGPGRILGALSKLNPRVTMAESIPRGLAALPHYAGGGSVRSMVKWLDEFLRPSIVKPGRGGNWLGAQPGGKLDETLSSLGPRYDYRIIGDGVSGDRINQVLKDPLAWDKGLAEHANGPYGSASENYFSHLANTLPPEVAAQMGLAAVPEASALKTWTKGPLRRYIMNDLATPGDPVRAYFESRTADIAAARAKALAKAQATREQANTIARSATTDDERRVALNLANNAEQATRQAEAEYKLAMNNVTHTPLTPETSITPADKTWMKHRRTEAGFPKPQGVSPAGKAWEDYADFSVKPYRVGKLNPARAQDDYSWLSKINDPNIPIYDLESGSIRELGFPHLVDSLQQRMASGALRPEKLQAVTVPQAVKWAAEENLAAARKMAEARAKSMEGMPTILEHPSGVRIVQLTKPGEFAAESDAMGHSVKGYEPPKVHKPSDDDLEMIDEIAGINSPTETRMYDELAAAGNDQPSGREALGWLVKNHPNPEKRAEAQRLLDKLAEGKHPDWIPESGSTGSLGYGIGNESGFGGGWEAIKRGAAKIYSVRDPATGETGATIEVKRGPTASKLMKYEDLPEDARQQFSAGRAEGFIPDELHLVEDVGRPAPGERYSWVPKGYDPEQYNFGHEITQIKGPQNGQVPEKFRPAIQDFLTQGQWHSVNTDKSGLLDLEHHFKGAPYYDEMMKELGGQRFIDPDSVPGDSIWQQYLSQGRGRQPYAQGGTVTPQADTHPSEAQIEAGNYKKGHIKVAGLDISIENPKGSRRRPEWPPLKHHYGYIKGTVGKDKDHIDVFVHPDTTPDFDGPIFVVDQRKIGNGHFDEHKVMLGFKSEGAARAGYKSNYTKGWTGDQAITAFKTPKAFREWLASADHTLPAAQTRTAARMKQLSERSNAH